MPLVILIIIAVMFLILIAWTWNSLGEIESKIKAISIIIGVILVYILTFIIFNISKIGIIYEEKQAMVLIRRVFVILFTIINSYLLLPFTFKKLNQINNGELERDKFQKSLLILGIMIVILFIFESIYLGNAQERILAMGIK